MFLDEAMQKAERLEATGELPQAEALYNKVLAANPKYHPAWHALGLLAFRVGKLEIAAEMIEKALQCTDSIALYHRNLGEICRRLGRLEQAVMEGEATVALNPNDSEGHYNLGLALAGQGRHTDALSPYRRATELSPEHGPAWNNLGASLEQSGDLAAAEEAYTHAVAINPKHAEAQNNLGAIYSLQGKLTAAVACFNAAIRARPSFVESHSNLSALKTYNEDDPHLLVLEALSATLQSANVDDQIHLNFALGKARHDIGEIDAAFAAYTHGNRLKFAKFPYDETSAENTLNTILKEFDHEFFAKRIQTGSKPWKRTPIFIVGMPRSGTSLIEQILATHPEVYGAGELIDLHEVIRSNFGAAFSTNFLKKISKSTADEFSAMGTEYLDRVWQLKPEAAFISDKMPANFFYVGLIHLLLPEAKIIHAMRDPMDSCFSCYTRLFENPSMNFTYDLGCLGRYYVRYMQIMRHWQSVLPPGKILNLRYEDMVTDMEGESKRMLNFIGLPWSKDCLAFYNNTRHVKTASVAQVRQPIYTSSLARWKKFEKHMAPLLAIIENDR